MDDSTLYSIHYKRNRAKALETLLGIIYGLTSDNKLNGTEILFLNLWLTENRFLRGDPDAIDIVDCLNDMIHQEIATSEQLTDLKLLLQQILQYRTTDPDREELLANTNILFGIIQGIMADQKLEDSEILNLEKWLSTHRSNEWPSKIISEKINEILKDGKISVEERDSLISLLNKCGANQLTNTGSPESTTVTIGTTQVDHITFEDRTFCFTGTFFSGNRKSCEQKILERRGRTASNISKKVDYLVLGNTPTRDWITSSFGLKIKGAIELQNDGHHIILLTEETWSAHL